MPSVTGKEVMGTTETQEILFQQKKKIFIAIDSGQIRPSFLWNLHP